MDMVKDACEILDLAVANNDHPGYYPQYMCRLLAGLYSTIGSIEYELNLPQYGGSWFKIADSRRLDLIENDTFEQYDLLVMAIGDGNIGLAHLAAMESPDSTIASFTFLLENFDDRDCRSVWAANLSIAYRLRGSLETSLEWCETALRWTRDVYGEEALSMAM